MQRHERFAMSCVVCPLWGRGRLARGGFAVCSLKMQSTQRRRDSRESVLWGRGRLARGGFAEGYASVSDSFQPKKFAVCSLKMQTTQRRRDSRDMREGARAYCGDAGVSPTEGLRRVGSALPLGGRA